MAVGNESATVVIIILVVCFAWVPILMCIGLARKGRARFHAFREARGWIPPVSGQQKATDVSNPQPAVPNLSLQSLEGSAPTRMRGRGESGSWDPVHNTTSRHPRPLPSRDGSLRSFASSHAEASRGRSRSRRSPAPRADSSPDRPPPSININDIYYNPTPLPKELLAIWRVHKERYRSESQGSLGSGSQTLGGASFDASSEGDHRHDSSKDQQHPSVLEDPKAPEGSSDPKDPTERDGNVSQGMPPTSSESEQQPSSDPRTTSIHSPTPIRNSLLAQGSSISPG